MRDTGEAMGAAKKDVGVAYVGLSSVEERDIEDSGGDSMLARYFRDMALHPVMGPEEELETARAVEKSELEHWVALLSYVPAAEHILATLEEQVAKAHN